MLYHPTATSTPPTLGAPLASILEEDKEDADNGKNNYDSHAVGTSANNGPSPSAAQLDNPDPDADIKEHNIVPHNTGT